MAVMADFKLSDSMCVLCLFLFFAIPMCLATEAKDQMRHARFFYDNVGDDNCGCQQGKCIHLGNGGFRCDCYDPAWTGERCDILAWTLSSTEQPKQQGNLNQCDLYCGHGHCVVNTDPVRYVNVNHCECDHGWYGEHCMIQQTQPMTMDHCYNHCQHGDCVGPDTHFYGYHCRCYRGWHGGHCEVKSEPIQMDLCNNHCQHGVCVGPDVFGLSHCECDAGFYGGHCQYQHMESTRNTPPTTTITTTTIKPATTTKPTTTTTKPTTTTTTTTSATTTTSTTTTPKPTPTTTITTSPPVSATSSKSVITTIVHSSLGFLPCDKSAILTAVATQSEVVNQNAGECSTGSRSSHDALVLTHCQVPNSASSWKQGINVMSHCSGSTSLPTYTAIAAFDNGMYSSKGSLSGIFLGCTANGFKMVFQSCGQHPQIAEIKMGGTNTLNPVVYYTVV